MITTNMMEKILSSINNENICPRCGGYLNENLIENSLSRHINTYICPKCGTDEAMRDMMLEKLEFEEWNIVIELLQNIGLKKVRDFIRYVGLSGTYEIFNEREKIIFINKEGEIKIKIKIAEKNVYKIIKYNKNDKKNESFERII